MTSVAYPQHSDKIEDYEVEPIEDHGLDITIENDPLHAKTLEEFYRRIPT